MFGVYDSYKEHPIDTDLNIIAEIANKEYLDYLEAIERNKERFKD